MKNIQEEFGSNLMNREREIGLAIFLGFEKNDPRFFVQ
jgi:hypothetical protein